MIDLKTISVQTLVNAVDCHTHVFLGENYPFASPRAYTPGEANVAQLRAMLAQSVMQRVVLVQASVYGTDNRCMLHAMQELGWDGARGVAVVNMASIQDEPQKHLQTLHHAGIRGLRINLHMGTEGLDLMRTQIQAAQVLKTMKNWHLQIHAGFDVHQALLPDYEALAKQGVSIVLDHFAGACLGNPRLDDLLAAMSKLPIYIKLSAAYRLPVPTQAPELAQLFYRAAPNRVLWGSDWPHTGGGGATGRHAGQIEPFREIDNPAALDTICQALGSQTATEQLLVRNPTELYDF